MTGQQLGPHVFGFGLVGLLSERRAKTTSHGGAAVGSVKSYRFMFASCRAPRYELRTTDAKRRRSNIHVHEFVHQ